MLNQYINTDFYKDKGISLIEKSWESEIIKKKVIQIEFNESIIYSKQNSNYVEKIISILMKTGLPWMLSARIPTIKENQIRIVENSNFKLIETYLSFEHDLNNISGELSNEIRPFEVEEIDILESIAFESFLYSRFHMDKEIPIEFANKTRALWLRNSCNGRAENVLVAVKDLKLAGFVICKLKKEKGNVYGNLDLIATSAKFRNQNIGKDLSIEFLNYCKNKDCDFARVGTQAHNIPSIRLYEKVGFRLSNSFYTFHKHLN